MRRATTLGGKIKAAKNWQVAQPGAGGTEATGTGWQVAVLAGIAAARAALPHPKEAESRLFPGGSTKRVLSGRGEWLDGEGNVKMGADFVVGRSHAQTAEGLRAEGEERGGQLLALHVAGQTFTALDGAKFPARALSEALHDAVIAHVKAVTSAGIAALLAEENEAAISAAAEVSAMRVAGSRDVDEDYTNNVLLGLVAGVAEVQWAVADGGAPPGGVRSGDVEESDRLDEARYGTHSLSLREHPSLSLTPPLHRPLALSLSLSLPA